MPVIGTYTIILWLVGSKFGGNDSMAIHPHWTKQACLEQAHKFEESNAGGIGMCIPDGKVAK